MTKQLQKLTVTLDFKGPCWQPVKQVHFVTAIYKRTKDGVWYTPSRDAERPLELVGVTQNGTVCFPWGKVLSYELEDIDPMSLCPKCNSHVTAGIGERFCLMCGHEWNDREDNE